MFGLRACVDKSLGSNCSKGWIQLKAHILKNHTDNEGKWKATVRAVGSQKGVMISKIT